MCGGLNSVLGLYYFFHRGSSESVPLKDDSETTTLVRGMHGLFEPVFPLTTNKSPCQSTGVYLARLPAIPHVLSSDSWHMSPSKPPARQKPPDTFHFSILSWPFCIMLRVFLIHSQTLPRYTHSFIEFRHTSFLWPHMHSEQARSQITSLTKLERKEFTFNQWNNCVFRVCVSVCFRNPSGQPHSCGEQHRGTSRLVYALRTSPMSTAALRGERKHIF